MNIFRRGEPGYEAARRDCLWNARLPDRFPELVVLARDAQDVAEAVRLAARQGMRVGVRSGGHSWSGNHVRDGGMLLDVSRLDRVTVDKAARRAVVGPGRKGHELAKMLTRNGLFFPTGHCRGVAVGGYLLQGGFGWNGRALGPACESIEALDLVTPEGDLVHASPTENSDLYWAARGSGPGFFCVVTAFHVKLHPKPAAVGVVLQSYPLTHLEELFTWAYGIRREVPVEVELHLIISPRALGSRSPGIDVFAPVLADDWKRAREAVRFLNDTRLARLARVRTPLLPSSLGILYRMVSSHYPDRYRYGVDNMWTAQPVQSLLPGLRRIAETLPPHPSHLLWLNWGPLKDRPDMAFSMEDDLYLGLYGIWKDASDDARYGSWATDRMREMEPLASGIQLADENLGARPARFMAEGNLQRLDEIRALRDPNTRFHPWMGRP